MFYASPTLNAAANQHLQSRSTAFVKRASDVEAATPQDLQASGSSKGLNIERTQSLVVEYRKRLLCMIKAYIGVHRAGMHHQGALGTATLALAL